MTTPKQQHLITMRSNTAYPIYRGVIGIITTILILIAVLQGIGALVLGLSLMSASKLGGLIALLIGLAFSVLAYFMARLWNEAAQILADVGDAVIDNNAYLASNTTMR